MEIRLTLVNQQNAEKHHYLLEDGDGLDIGRNTHNDLCINHQTVDREHCEIYQKEKSIILKNFSKFTSVNDEKVKRKKSIILKNNDTLTIGNSTFVVFIDHDRSLKDIQEINVKAGQIESFIGQQIENYEITEHLCTGDTAWIFKAIHKSYGNNVAIKILKKNNRNTVKRFIRSAKTMQKITHPLIARVFSLKMLYLNIESEEGTARKTVYYTIMEYIDGPSLNRLQPPINIKNALNIFQQIISSFITLEKKRIIYRNLTPSNIIYSKEEGFIKLSGFGFIKPQGDEKLGTVTVVGAALGTFGYSDPRIIQPHGKKPKKNVFDNRCDIFSIGTIMYYLLTKKHAYSTKLNEWYQEIKNQSYKNIPKITLINPSVDYELEKIIHKCFEYNPKKRFQSVKELSAALTNYLNRRENERIKVKEVEAEKDDDTKQLENSKILLESRMDLETFNNIELIIDSNPLKVVSGDFYKSTKLDENRIAFILADVIGHGVAVTSPIHGFIDKYDEYLKTEKNLVDVVEKLNTYVHVAYKKYSEKKRERFNIETLIGIIDKSTHKLTFCQNTKNPLIIFNQKRPIRPLIIQYNEGIPLGNCPKSNAKAVTIDLMDQDQLMISTDGLTEALDKDYNQFGILNVCDIFVKNYYQKPEEIFKLLKEGMEKHIDGNEMEDDYTIMYMKYNKV